MAGAQDQRRSYRARDDYGGSLGDDLAATNDRLDELTQQLERLGYTSADRARAGAGGVDERPSAQVANALAQLDQRLDQVIGESRVAAGQDDRGSPSASPPPSQPSPPAPVTPAHDPLPTGLHRLSRASARLMAAFLLPPRRNRRRSHPHPWRRSQNRPPDRTPPSCNSNSARSIRRSPRCIDPANRRSRRYAAISLESAGC